MKKEITLQDVISVVESTNNKVEKLADALDKSDKNLTEAIGTTSKMVEFLAVTMTREFGKVHQEIERLDKKIEGVEVGLNKKIDGVETKLTAKIEGVEVSLNKKIDGVEIKLSEKIESEVGNLAGMCKREFDEIGARFNRVDNEFKEVHEELKQVNSNVIGLDRRVTKLEKTATR